LSTVPGSVFGVDNIVSKDPSSYVDDKMGEVDPGVKKVMQHIQEKAACSDYEVGSIMAIMANHSKQKQGFDFYIKYISGNDTEDLYHKAPYYRQYVNYWDHFAEEWKDTTVKEKAEALNVDPDTMEGMEKVFNNMSPDEADYILPVMEPYTEKMEKTGDEIINTSVSNVGKLKSKSSELNLTVVALSHAVLNAHQEYLLTHQSSQDMGSSDSGLVEAWVDEYQGDIRKIMQDNSTLTDEKFAKLNILKSEYLDLNKTKYKPKIKSLKKKQSDEYRRSETLFAFVGVFTLLSIFCGIMAAFCSVSIVLIPQAICFGILSAICLLLGSFCGYLGGLMDNQASSRNTQIEKFEKLDNDFGNRILPIVLSAIDDAQRELSLDAKV